MDNRFIIEEYFRSYVDNIHQWLPEDIINVDLNLLKEFNLLIPDKNEQEDPSLTQYFHVVESPEKITLINDNFIVWIVPKREGNVPITYTLIAHNRSEFPELEMAFTTKGVYNTSKLVLRILEKFLHEIKENEMVISNFDAD